MKLNNLNIRLLIVILLIISIFVIGLYRAYSVTHTNSTALIEESLSDKR